MEESKYLLVERNVLPEVFVKVCQAKSLIAKGEAKNSSEAARMVGISRSAFYKYRDSVHWYDKSVSDSIASLYLNLVDEAGILSSVISKLYEYGANILTINQNIPVDSVAPVTISIKTTHLHADVDTLIAALKNLPGVVKARAFARS